MALPISKLAPTAVVIAAVSCCAWPYVFPSDPGGQKAAAMPEITTSQLSPYIGPPPARDPFRAAGEPVAVAAKPVKAAPAKIVPAKIAPASIAGSKGAAAARSVAAAGGKPKTDPLSGLALSATSIFAEQRLAVINGRIYSERERLKSKDPSAPPCVVARILPDRVLLECEGQTATLSYATVAAKAKAKHTGGTVEVSVSGPPPQSQPPARSQPAGPHNQPQL
jgi:hypothetical protein